MLSVDVVAIRFRDGLLRLALGTRQFEPYQGKLALPGVLMAAGETINDAATRAIVTKLGVPDPGSIRLLQHARFYDTPGRDLRGPTVTNTCIAVVHPDTESTATWVPIDDHPALPFDHTTIVANAHQDIRKAVWENPDLLAALLGDPFPTTAMVALDYAVTGVLREHSNVHRTLSGVPFLQRVDGPISGRGRPQHYWQVRT